MMNFLGKCEDRFSDAMEWLLHFAQNELPVWLAWPIDILVFLAGVTISIAWLGLLWIFVPRKYHP